MFNTIIGAINVAPEAWAFVGTLIGIGSAFTLALKRTWSNRDRADDAYIRARDDAKTEREKDMQTLREEFEERFLQQEERHKTLIEDLNLDIQRLRWAIVNLIPLVAADKIEEAMKILVELNLNNQHLDIDPKH